MTILPPGSEIEIDGNTLVVSDLSYTFVYEFFDRQEYVHEKQRSAKEENGTLPIFITKLGGGVAQISYTCNPTTPRPVTPDDSDIDNIKKRFDIKRWNVKFVDCLPGSVAAIYTLYQSHKTLLAEYQARLNQLSLDLSITELEDLQTDATPFTNLTNTGIVCTGAAFASETLSNALITDMTVDTNREIPTQGVYQSGSITLEERTYLPARA